MLNIFNYIEFIAGKYQYIIQLLIAIGTIGAVIVSLWLALRAKPHISCYIVKNLGNSNHWELHITNIGNHEARLDYNVLYVQYLPIPWLMVPYIKILGPANGLFPQLSKSIFDPISVGAYQTETTQSALKFKLNFYEKIIFKFLRCKRVLWLTKNLINFYIVVFNDGRKYKIEAPANFKKEVLENSSFD